MVKRIKYKTGDVFKINLNASFSYGRILSSPLMAFYKRNYVEDQKIDDLCQDILAFKVWVNDEAIISGRWPVVGNKELESYLQVEPKFFKQDPITKMLYTYKGGIESPSSIEECLKYEKAAVWAPRHIEERLESLFSGKESKFELMVNSIK